MMHTCKKCGKQFEDERKRATVCFECRTVVCVICGKRFEPTNKGQLTCSQKCSGIRKSQLGIAARSAATKPTKMKVCKFCGKEFLPRTFRQVYCDGPHYRACIICGKPIQLSSPSDPTSTCSMECRTKAIQATCLEKYGNVNVLNSDHGKELAQIHCQERYGVDCVQHSDEWKQKVKSTMLERYGTEHALQNADILTKFKQTNLERYGGYSATCSEEVSQKARRTIEERYGGYGMASTQIREKIEATNLSSYGVKFAFQSEEIREKIRNILVEKYGTDVVAHIEGVREKARQTSLERYGVPYPSQSAEVKATTKRSCNSKYGVDNIMELQEYVEKSQQNLRAVMVEKYGQPASMLVPELRAKIEKSMTEKYGATSYFSSEDFQRVRPEITSRTNKAFEKLLDDANIKYEPEFSIQYDESDARHHFVYDLKLDNKLLIEIDPTYTHNSFYNHWNNITPSDYHQRKSKVAKDFGYRCVHVFEWDSWDSIVELISPKQIIYARKCETHRVSQETADDFTLQNHLQGRCRGQVINYGLYLNDELVEVMTFGKPRYNKKYDLELLRLCSLKGVRVIGGASKLFKRFKEENPDRSVISYCNLAKFTGEVYEKIGMKLDHVSPPAKVWSKGDKFITDNMLRSRGYDQLFGTHFGKGTDNEALMLTDGWLPVYDCGQAVYVYKP